MHSRFVLCSEISAVLCFIEKLNKKYVLFDRSKMFHFYWGTKYGKCVSKQYDASSKKQGEMRRFAQYLFSNPWGDLIENRHLRIMKM